MKLTEAKLKELILEIMTEPQLPADFPTEYLEKLRSLTYSNNPEDLNSANSLFASLGYEGLTGNYFLDMEEYKKPAEFERMGQETADMFEPDLNQYGFRSTKDEYDSRDIERADYNATRAMIRRAEKALGPDASFKAKQDYLQRLDKRYRSTRSPNEKPKDKKKGWTK